LLAPVAAHAASARILYAGDWAGAMQIFLADPTGKASTRQVTFARPDGPCFCAAACGYMGPLPSPDGRRLAYWSGGFIPPLMLWFARGDGGAVRRVSPASDAAWAPDSTRLAYSALEGIHVLTTTTGIDRIVDRQSVVGVLPTAASKESFRLYEVRFPRGPAARGRPRPQRTTRHALGSRSSRETTALPRNSSSRSAPTSPVSSSMTSSRTRTSWRRS
jgi:hypothetical protein